MFDILFSVCDQGWREYRTNLTEEETIDILIEAVRDDFENCDSAAFGYKIVPHYED